MVKRTGAKKGTPFQQALSWVNEELWRRPQSDKLALIDEASQRFNLSPVDGDALIRVVMGGSDKVSES